MKPANKLAVAFGLTAVAVVTIIVSQKMGSNSPKNENLTGMSTAHLSIPFNSVSF